MKISVIIPTRNRPDDLARCIDSILIQSLLPDELIVVDSSDAVDRDLNNVLRIEENIHIIYLRSTPGLTHQKNVGIEASSGDILFFFDDDIVLEKDFIKEVVDIFTYDVEGKIAGIGGEVVDAEKHDDRHGVSLVNRIAAAVHSFIDSIFGLDRFGYDKSQPSSFIAPPDKPEAINRVEFIPGGLSGWRKSIFNEFKFDENLLGSSLWEDVDFGYRVSRQYIIIQTPYAKAIHNFSPQGREDLKPKTKIMLETYYYLFKKNIPQTFKHRLALFWKIMGFCLFATLLTLKNRDGRPLKGVIAGLIDIVKKRKLKTISAFQVGP